LRSDNVLECVKYALQNYCDLHGIIHQISSVYAPQQNVVGAKKTATFLKLAGSWCFIWVFQNISGMMAS